MRFINLISQHSRFITLIHLLYYTKITYFFANITSVVRELLFRFFLFWFSSVHFEVIIDFTWAWHKGTERKSTYTYILWLLHIIAVA